MKNPWKSIIIVVVCIAMLWSSSSPALAQANTITYTYNGKVYIVTTAEDANQVRSVHVKSAEGTSIVVLDKKTNLAKLTQVNAHGTIVLHKSVPVVTTAANPLPQENVTTSGVIASGSEIMWSHKYFVVSGVRSSYTWNIHKGNNVKVRQENPGNVAHLNGFKNDVDSAAKNEAIAAAAVGTGTLLAIAGMLSTAGTVTIGLIVGLLFALGAYSTAAGVIYSAWIDCKNADYHYARVK